MHKLPQAKLKTITGSAVKLSRIIKKPTVILVVRRPGCLLSRSQAFKLDFFKDHINKMGFEMIAITKEFSKVTAFSSSYWRSKVYIDTELEMFKFVGKGKIRKLNLLSILKWDTLKVCRSAVNEGFALTKEGESLILGGLVITTETGKVIYHYREKFFGDHADVTEILNVCKSHSGYDIDVEDIVSEAKNENLLKYSSVNKFINIDHLPLPCVMVDYTGKILFKNKEANSHPVASHLKNNIFSYCKADLISKQPERVFFNVNDKVTSEIVWKIHFESDIIMFFSLSIQDKNIEHEMMKDINKKLKIPINKLITISKAEQSDPNDQLNECIIELVQVNNDVVDYIIINFDDFVVRNNLFDIRERLSIVPDVYGIPMTFSYNVPGEVYSNDLYISQIIITLSEIVDIKEIKVSVVSTRLYFSVSCELSDDIVSFIKGHINLKYDGFPGTCASIHVCRRICIAMGGALDVNETGIVFFVNMEEIKIPYSQLEGKNVLVYLTSKTDTLELSQKLILHQILPLIVFSDFDASYNIQGGNVDLVITDTAFKPGRNLAKIPWSRNLLND